MTTINEDDHSGRSRGAGSLEVIRRAGRSPAKTLWPFEVEVAIRGVAADGTETVNLRDVDPVLVLKRIA